MPIQSVVRGLMERGLAFPEIAQVRKGTHKQKTASGGETMGKDLDYFRVEFAEGEEEAAKLFAKAFGPQPKEFIALIPFKEIDRCWDYWREAYVRAKGKAGGMLIHRCNGEMVNFARDPQSKEITVINWHDKEGHQVACDPRRPVLSYKNKDGKQIETFCKQTGRLRLIVPALGRCAYVMLHTTSWYDVVNITGNLESLASLRNNDIRGIPLIVRRRWVERNTPFGRSKMNLIFIEADPKWVQSMLTYVQQNALPEIKMLAEKQDTEQDQGEPPAAPDGWETEGEEMGQIIEGEEESDFPETETDFESVNEMSAGSIKIKVCQWVEKRAGAIANGNQIGLAARMIEDCFDTDDDQKKECRVRVCKYLFGEKPSGMEGRHHLAILDWLRPTKDQVGDGKYHPNPDSAKEARIVEREQLRIEGQDTLPGLNETPQGGGGR